MLWPRITIWPYAGLASRHHSWLTLYCLHVSLWYVVAAAENWRRSWTTSHWLNVRDDDKHVTHRFPEIIYALSRLYYGERNYWWIVTDTGKFKVSGGKSANIAIHSIKATEWKKWIYGLVNTTHVQSPAWSLPRWPPCLLESDFWTRLTFCFMIFLSSYQYFISGSIKLVYEWR